MGFHSVYDDIGIAAFPVNHGLDQFAVLDSADFGIQMAVKMVYQDPVFVGMGQVLSIPADDETVDAGIFAVGCGSIVGAARTLVFFPVILCQLVAQPS